MTTGVHRALVRPAMAAILSAGLLAAHGCRQGERGAPERELVVFAAASLRDAFAALAPGFERARPGVRVVFNFAGSQELRTQIEQGAAADLFASADQRHMEALVRAGRASDPILFARNEPVVIVRRERASSLSALAELPDADRIVVGAPEVPIGRYTARILERAAARLGADWVARLEAKIVSRELNVRQVLAKVSLGEADAGVVYRSDAAGAAGRVALVPIPGDLNVVAEYPIAIVAGASHPELARTWLDLLRSPVGQDALVEAGFLPAPREALRP